MPRAPSTPSPPIPASVIWGFASFHNPLPYSKRIRDASIYTSKNIAQAFILERYFFVSIYPAVIPGTYLMVFLVVAL
ncbi:MAG: hypothetical protein PUB53_04405, partial [Bacteroidales bacterium]|nr:hypothetical protein [Bacteroidales bacterium]